MAGLRIVGGQLALDFANTVDGVPDGEPGFDFLHDYADLLAWSRRVDLIPKDSTLRLMEEAERRADEARDVHRRALELREAVYQVFRAVAERRDPPSEKMEVLRRSECQALDRGRLEPVEGGFVWRWPDETDLARMVWPVAHAATELLTSGRLDRVKRCAHCRWLFVDASKNKSRRWCTMEECGTHEKSRRYVAKRAARRKEG